MIDDGLYVALSQGDLALAPLVADHREGLRVACAADDAIWQMYPFNYQGADFDPQFDRLLAGGAARRCYAVLHHGEVVGMTAWIDAGQPGWSIEIGNSYLVPASRGTGLNRRMKQLLIDHAIAQGLERVVFKVDQRNARSQAAVLKLGATCEGVLRHERKTWTGWVRDTVVFSVLRSEWVDRSVP